MWKDEAQPMCAWITAIQSVLHELADAGTEVLEDDIIVILSLGLPPTYENVVIMLDTTPNNQFTLDLIICKIYIIYLKHIFNICIYAFLVPHHLK